MIQCEFKIRVSLISALAAFSLLLSCSGGAGGFEGAGRKDTKKPAEDDKKTDEPAEVAGAFLSCLTGIQDDIVKPGQIGVGCGVYAPDGAKIDNAALIFKGQILEANKTPVSTASRAGSPGEDYHYIASVPADTIASGYAGMRVEKMGTNQRKDFEPVLLSRAQSFAACSPNCAPAAIAASGAGAWVFYGLVPTGSSPGVAQEIDAALALGGSGGTSGQVAQSLKSSFTGTAIAAKRLIDRSEELRSKGTPDWVGAKKSCTTLPNVPYRDFGKVAVFSVRLLNEVEGGSNRHLVVAVDKADKSFEELKNMTSPSTHPVCAAVLVEKAVSLRLP